MLEQAWTKTLHGPESRTEKKEIFQHKPPPEDPNDEQFV